LATTDATLVAAQVVGDPQAELAEDVAARAKSRCRSLLEGDDLISSLSSRHLTSEAVVDADLALDVGLAGLAGDGTRDEQARAAAREAGLDAGQAEAVAALGGTGAGRGDRPGPNGKDGHAGRDQEGPLGGDRLLPAATGAGHHERYVDEGIESS
jgi:hypothetical protein